MIRPNTSLLAALSLCAPAFSCVVFAQEQNLSERADALFAQAEADRDLSGTLLLRRDGETVLMRHYGLADFVAETPHQADTRYSVASVTKGVTAALIVELGRRGGLSLSDPVVRHLPQLEDLQPFTIAQVLEHTAGLPRDFPDGWSEASVADWLADNPGLQSQRGEESYSNIGYALLAEIAEAVGGEDFAQLARRLVLSPAGMIDSRILPRDAGAYRAGASGWSPGPEPMGVQPAIAAPLEPGASGLVTTASDLALWAEGLASGAYPEFFATEDGLGSVDAGTHAIGSYVSVQGSLPGYFANAISWEGGRSSAVFVGNLFSAPALSMREDLLLLASEEPIEPRSAQPTPIPSGELHERLVGRYTLPGFGDAAIERVEGAYRLSMIGKPAFWSFHLTPIADGFHWRAFDRIIVLEDGKVGIQRRGESEWTALERPSR